MTPVQHNNECRLRIEARIAESEEGKARLEANFARLLAHEERKGDLRADEAKKRSQKEAVPGAIATPRKWVKTIGAGQYSPTTPPALTPGTGSSSSQLPAVPTLPQEPHSLGGGDLSAKSPTGLVPVFEAPIMAPAEGREETRARDRA